MKTTGLSVTHVLMTLRRDDAEVVAPGLGGEWLALVRSEAVRMLAEYDAMGGAPRLHGAGSRRHRARRGDAPYGRPHRDARGGFEDGLRIGGEMSVAWGTTGSGLVHPVPPQRTAPSRRRTGGWREGPGRREAHPVDPATGLKECSRCRRRLEPDRFPVSSRGALLNMCRECKRAYEREGYRRRKRGGA